MINLVRISMEQIGEILFVEYCERLQKIRFKVRWNGVDLRGRQRHPSFLYPEEIWSDPLILLESDAWLEYCSSPNYFVDISRNPEAFNVIDMMHQRIDDMEKGKQGPDVTLTSWEIAKERFEASTCPICFEDFQDNDIVSVFSCNHSLCIKCHKKWEKCVYKCSAEI